MGTQSFKLILLMNLCEIISVPGINPKLLFNKLRQNSKNSISNQHHLKHLNLNQSPLIIPKLGSITDYDPRSSPYHLDGYNILRRRWDTGRKRGEYEDAQARLEKAQRSAKFEKRQAQNSWEAGMYRKSIMNPKSYGTRPVESERERESIRELDAAKRDLDRTKRLYDRAEKCFEFQKRQYDKTGKIPDDMYCDTFFEDSDDGYDTNRPNKSLLNSIGSAFVSGAGKVISKMGLENCGRRCS